MKTKSSLFRILWSSAYIIVAVVGPGIVTAEPANVQDSPQRDRTVVRKPWSVEPVKVVAAKNKKKQKIEIGKAFDDDDDWLDGFTVTVVNNSDKTVTAVTIERVFRREPGDTRPPVAQALHFGPSPIGSEYLLRDPNKVIKVGETGDLQISPQNYKSMKGLLQRQGYPDGIQRVEVVIREVGFEDGSVLLTGTFYAQDPNNPNDPTKKIPVGQQPGGTKRRPISKLLNHRSKSRGTIFRQTLLASPHSTLSDCFAKERNHATGMMTI